MSSYMVEVQCDATDFWYHNDMRFDSRSLAQHVGVRMYQLSVQIHRWRVVEVDEPPNYTSHPITGAPFFMGLLEKEKEND